MEQIYTYLSIDSKAHELAMAVINANSNYTNDEDKVVDKYLELLKKYKSELENKGAY